jgi:uncharacterized protein YkwD
MRSPALLVLAFACTPVHEAERPKSGPSQPTPPPVPAPEAATPAPPIELELEPRGTAARLYNVIAPSAPTDPLAPAILGEIAAGAREAGRTPPEPDSRLHAAARDLAMATPRRGSLPQAAVEFALQHYGVVEPTPAMVVLRAGGPGAEELPADVAGRLRELTKSGRYGRVGIATASTDDASTTVVLLLKSYVDMQALPRFLKTGDSVEMRAKVLAPYVSPELLVTTVGGTVEKQKLETLSDGRVRATLRCKGPAGPRQIELLAQDDLGPSVLANFPIWCGTPPPQKLRVRVEQLDMSSQGALSAEQHLLELVNAERRRAKLEPLIYDPKLAAVARAHSLEMVRTGIVAHTMPTTGTAADRVRAGGIATSLVQENLARATSTDEAHIGLMNSPSHRANILEPDVTHLGTGIAFDAGLTRDMFVTELFIRIPPPVDATAGRNEISARLKKTAKRLLPSDLLGGIAQREAEELAGGGDTGAVGARVVQALQGAENDFVTVKTMVAALARFSDFDAAPAGADKVLTHFGVGVAQGNHPRLGPNTIYVVVVLAGSAGGA